MFALKHKDYPLFDALKCRKRKRRKKKEYSYTRAVYLSMCVCACFPVKASYFLCSESSFQLLSGQELHN